MTVWNLHHSKFAIFSIERKRVIFDAEFILILKIDLVEYLCKHHVWM